MLRVIVVALLGTAIAAAPPEVPKSADTSVIGINLDDPSSTEAVLGKDTPWEEESAVLPSAYFVNAAMTEELRLTVHNGSYANSVSEFLVSSPPKSGRKTKALPKVQSFTTGKGVHIGMTPKELVTTLGPPARMDKKGTRTIYRYAITDMASSPFLQHYNMPSYYGIYSFTKGRLVEYGFGFEYP